jgi:hypothetical protein
MSRAALSVIKRDKDAASAAYPSAKCSKSEEADDYFAVVAGLNKTWRVIVCSAGIQWVLQSRRGQRRGGARWEGRSYCRTKEAIICLSVNRRPKLTPDRRPILTPLSDGFWR